MGINILCNNNVKAETNITFSNNSITKNNFSINFVISPRIRFVNRSKNKNSMNATTELKAFNQLFTD